MKIKSYGYKPKFGRYGRSCDPYEHPFITAAIEAAVTCAVGMTVERLFHHFFEKRQSCGDVDRNENSLPPTDK